MEGNSNQYYLQQMGVDIWLLRSNNNKEHRKVKLLIVADGFDVVEKGCGLSFSLRSRKLLHKMLSSINLTEEDVRMMPSINRGHLMNHDGLFEERTQLRDAVTQQMMLVAPKVILVLGHDLGQCFFNDKLSLNDMRTQKQSFDNIPVIVSYHPDDLLEHPLDKKMAYYDWLSLKQLLMDE